MVEKSNLDHIDKELLHKAYIRAMMLLSKDGKCPPNFDCPFPGKCPYRKTLLCWGNYLCADSGYSDTASKSGKGYDPIL